MSIAVCGLSLFDSLKLWLEIEKIIFSLFVAVLQTSEINVRMGVGDEMYLNSLCVLLFFFRLLIAM